MEELVRKTTTRIYDESGNIKEETVEEVYKEQEVIYIPQPSTYPQWPQDWGQPTWWTTNSTSKAE